jgi:CxxC motif-containing protein (DUF1111 family)
MKHRPLIFLTFTLVTLFFAGMAFAQTDPGVQGGNRGTGAALAAVTSNDNGNNPGLNNFFLDGQTRFQNAEVVKNATNTNVGLGPRFNSVSCVSCHAQPAVGGTGPAVNPQFAFAGSSIAPADTRPFFITQNGPTREARFPFFFNSDGSANTDNPNGGVEDLFTVTRRADAGNCNLQQPSFAAAAAANNLIFRIPTPVFGAGLIENLDDSTLLKNQVNNLNNNFGVSGTFNHNGNDGTITRFGWKAQNKSLHIFSGEAYNVEMGISNLLFQQDRPLPGEDGNGGTGGLGLPANCLNLSGIGYPEDNSNPGQTTNAAVLDDVSAFANFMRFLAPPPASTTTPGGSASISRGRADFIAIGCATCHNASPGSTQVSSSTPTTSGTGSLSLNAVNAFSDIEIHHMGTLLADNVGQGGAGGDQFRSAPLWGLGQRIFLLHDGRTTNLITAINDHFSNGSEANQAAINFFNGLSGGQQQDVLNFLRSL